MSPIPPTSAQSDQQSGLIVTGEAVEQEIDNVQQMLLTLPEGCGRSPCFWEIDPGETTYREFEEILLQIFVTQRIPYEGEEFQLEGVHGQISFSASARAHTVDDTVDQIILSIHPSSAQRLYDLGQVVPASVIRYFGVPSNAFILGTPDNANFTIFLLFEEQAFVYEIDTLVEDRKLCLDTDSIDDISLNRFRDRGTAMAYINFRTASPPPQSLVDRIEESLEDLPTISALNAPCLTLKSESH